jgi:hypothetical protein
MSIVDDVSAKTLFPLSCRVESLAVAVAPSHVGACDLGRWKLDSSRACEGLEIDSVMTLRREFGVVVEVVTRLWLDTKRCAHQKCLRRTCLRQSSRGLEITIAIRITHPAPPRPQQRVTVGVLTGQEHKMLSAQQVLRARAQMSHVAALPWAPERS